MELVSFISIEDNPPDLILSFAIWQPELEEIRSLILMRTPEYEFMLDEVERGVNVSVDKEEIEQAKTILQRMNFDNHFEMRLTGG